MNAHTSGPWFLSPADEWTTDDGRHVQHGRFDISAGSADIKDESYYRVASVSNVNNSDANLANAKLIAAAPRMLEAGNDLLFVVATLGRELGLDATGTGLTLTSKDGTSRTISLTGACIAWLEAVSKATGEQA